MEENEEKQEKQGRKAYDFSQFKKAVNDIAAESLTTYFAKFNKNRYSSTERKTPEEIDKILATGNEVELRDLSRQYWVLSGLYKRILTYISEMLTYDILVTPKLKSSKSKKDVVLRSLNDTCDFLDSLTLEKELARIMLVILQDGVYYGFFKECDNGKMIFQDLNPKYCRTRYKSSNGLAVLEFDLTYFLQLKGREATTNVNELELYPPYVQQAYRKYFDKQTRISNNKKYFIDSQNKLEEGRWLMIPDYLGIAFYFVDTKPYFASTIKAVEELNDYKGLEKSLDEQDLKKILLQKIPMNKDTGELLFTLDEALELHKATLTMMKNNADVDVLTSFADTEMLDIQDSAQANRDNLEKMERSTYNEAGVSKNLFDTDSSMALEYSLTNDMSLALNIAKIFESFLNYQINKNFANKNVFFEVTILPITHYNREKMFDLYLKGAQYGYSKLLAGVAAGIKQSNLLNLVTLENDYLELSSKMIPLQSSHTTSGTDIAEENGAPEKDETEKSDKTRQNEESL